MRLLVMVLALTLTCTAVMAVEICPPGTTPAAMGAGPAGDQAFDACLARALGMTPDQLYAFRAQGLTNADLAIASAISRQSNQPVANVVTQYRVTPNWQTVAEYYRVDYANLGISPDYLNPDVNVFNQTFISQQYGTTVADIQALRNQGFSWGEVNLIANAATRTGLTTQQIAQMRLQGMSWQSIASQYNLPATTLTVPCPVIAPRLSCCAAYAAGPVCTSPVIPAMYNRAGNVLLTQDEVFRYYAKGYDWTEVAIAANIARETGYPVDQVLRDMRSGMVWPQVAFYYGVSPNTAFDVCAYPFPRRSIYSASTEARNLQRIARYQTTPIAPGAAPLYTPTQPDGAITPATAPVF